MKSNHIVKNESFFLKQLGDIRVLGIANATFETTFVGVITDEEFNGDAINFFDGLSCVHEVLKEGKTMSGRLPFWLCTGEGVLVYLIVLYIVLNRVIKLFILHCYLSFESVPDNVDVDVWLAPQHQSAGGIQET